MNTSLEGRRIRPLTVVTLACLALLFPIVSMILILIGGSPVSIGMSSEWMWILVAAAWILIVWLRRTPRPLITLVLVGVAGGILTVLAVIVIQFSFTDSATILTAPIGMIAIVALSTIVGLVCGLIAWGLQSITHTPSR